MYTTSDLMWTNLTLFADLMHTVKINKSLIKNIFVWPIHLFLLFFNETALKWNLISNGINVYDK